MNFGGENGQDTPNALKKEVKPLPLSLNKKVKPPTTFIENCDYRRKNVSFIDGMSNDKTETPNFGANLRRQIRS